MLLQSLYILFRGLFTNCLYTRSTSQAFYQQRGSDRDVLLQQKPPFSSPSHPKQTLSDGIRSILLIYSSSGQTLPNTPETPSEMIQGNSLICRHVRQFSKDNSHPAFPHTQEKNAEGEPNPSPGKMRGDRRCNLLPPAHLPHCVLCTGGFGEHGRGCKLRKEEKLHFSQLNYHEPELSFMNSLSLQPWAKFSCI